MNRNEVLYCLNVIKVNYPHTYKNLTKQENEILIDSWHDMFCEDDANLVLKAIKQTIISSTSDFAPSIGKIKQKMFELCNPNIIDEQEAWAMIMKVLPRCDKGTKAILEELPPLVQKCIGNPSQLREWAYMETSTLNSVVASNFMRSYREILKRDKENSLMSDNDKKIFNIETQHTLKINSNQNKQIETNGDSHEFD